MRWSGQALVYVASLGLAFEAGRRYPFAFLERPAKVSTAAAPGWQELAPAPLARYESSTAVVRGRLYVFGGYHFPRSQATPRVDIYDPGTNSWSRARDMPEAITHRQAAAVGDTVWLAGGFLGTSPGPATDEVWGYDAAADRWFEGPKLPAPRAGGALVFFRNRLHHYGGFGPDRTTPFGDHWVLDLAEVGRGRGRWQSAAPLPEPRGQFAGAALDGFLYAVGGSIRHDPVHIAVDAVHCYDPTTDSWTAVASLPSPRSHFEPGIFTYRGRIFIVGGRNWTTEPKDLASVTMYNPRADEWTTVLQLPKRRSGPVAVVIGDTLIVGLGLEQRVGPRDPTMWMHRLSPGWLVGDSMRVALGEVSGGVVHDRLLVVGQGSSHTLAFDFPSGSWLPPDHFAHRPMHNNHHAAEAVDGKLYLVGGFGNGPNLVQIFDPARNRWSFGPDMPFRAGSSASAVINGQIYIAGGIDITGDTTIAATAKLDPRTRAWTLLAPMPLPRHHAAAATDGARLYVFGGRASGRRGGHVLAKGFDEVQVYDPATDSWTVSRTEPTAPAPLPQARGGTGKAVYAEGRFWVFGGESVEADSTGATESGVYHRVDVYDPVTNTWASGPPLPTARHGVLPVLRDGHIFVAGGGVRPGGSRSRVLEILRLSIGPAERVRPED